MDTYIICNSMHGQCIFVVLISGWNINFPMKKTETKTRVTINVHWPTFMRAKVKPP